MPHAQVGASARLGTIIEGESLLNDGVAYVLFQVFKVRAQDGWVRVRGGLDWGAGPNLCPSDGNGLIFQGCTVCHTP